MEERPEIRGQNKDIEPVDRKKEIEILAPRQKKHPFISFRYSYREVSSVGGNTYVKAKEKSYENGKFKSEEFEGTTSGNLHANMAAEMHKMVLGQIVSVMKAFTTSLLGVKKDKKD